MAALKKDGTPRKQHVPHAYPNKKTQTLRKKALEMGYRGTNPLEFVLEVMRDPDKPFDIRLDAAKAALPYVHPRLQAIHVQQGGEVKKHEDWVKEIAAVVIEGEARETMVDVTDDGREGT